MAGRLGRAEPRAHDVGSNHPIHTILGHFHIGYRICGSGMDFPVPAVHRRLHWKRLERRLSDRHWHSTARRRIWQG